MFCVLKKYISLLPPAARWGLSACILLFGCNPGTGNTQGQAEIRFNKTIHDFAAVAFNTLVSHQFIFTNPGDQKLLIQDIQTSCGCTVPEWPTKPIKKGEKESIHIVFDADHPGVFNKTITVYYNGKHSPDTLYIRGRVSLTPKNTG